VVLFAECVAEDGLCFGQTTCGRVSLLVTDPEAFVRELKAHKLSLHRQASCGWAFVESIPQWGTLGGYWFLGRQFSRADGRRGGLGNALQVISLSFLVHSGGE
jgi:hypothetical protein